MKFSAAREALLKPLQTVVGVVERRQTMPILSNVLLSTRGNESSAVTATDLEVEMVAEAEVKGEGTGDITVPGRKLHDIFRALPDGNTRRIQPERRPAHDQSGSKPIHAVDAACGRLSDDRRDRREANFAAK